MFFSRNFYIARAVKNPARAMTLFFALAIVAAWLWLYRAMFEYLGALAAREDFRLNQLLLLGVVALIARQIHAGQWRLRFHATPRFYPLPFLLAGGASLAYLAAERFLDINTLSAILFGVASYGLLGLYLTPSGWRQGLPAALLLIGVLPFAEHMQTFLGFPMRVATAEIVRQAFAGLGIASTGTDTILILENGVAQIDSPCSGVKSLWTGALFLLAATWLDRRVVNMRWLLIALIFAALLFASNLLRVAALVVSAQVLNLPILAQMLHVPLGILGFGGASAAAVALLRIARVAPTHFAAPTDVAPASRYWLAPLLLTSILGMGILYAPRPHTGLQRNEPQWNLPVALQTTALPLKPDERAWLTRDGAESATRLRFQWQGLTGSMILVPSRTWRAHHYPERCFQVYGLTTDESHAQLVAENFSARAVTLRDPKSAARLNATYWFQSATRITDDYGARMWADTVAPAERWVLVSILFDQPLDANDARAISFYRALRAAVAQQLSN